jgi:hypothetical protein
MTYVLRTVYTRSICDCTCIIAHPVNICVTRDYMDWKASGSVHQRTYITIKKVGSLKPRVPGITCGRRPLQDYNKTLLCDAMISDLCLKTRNIVRETSNPICIQEMLRSSIVPCYISSVQWGGIRTSYAMRSEGKS